MPSSTAKHVYSIAPRYKNDAERCADLFTRTAEFYTRLCETHLKDANDPEIVEMKKEMCDLYVATKAALDRVHVTYEACVNAGEPLLRFGRCPSEISQSYQTAVNNFDASHLALGKLCEEYQNI